MVCIEKETLLKTQEGTTKNTSLGSVFNLQRRQWLHFEQTFWFR